MAVCHEFRSFTRLGGEYIVLSDKQLARLTSRRNKALSRLNAAQFVERENKKELDRFKDAMVRAKINKKQAYHDRNQARTHYNWVRSSCSEQMNRLRFLRPRDRKAETARLRKQIASAKAAYREQQRICVEMNERYAKANQLFVARKMAYKRVLSRLDRAKMEYDEAEEARAVKFNTLVLRKAGLASWHVDDVKITVKDDDGTVHVYFGGIDIPDGTGHGHYAMDSDGNIIYRRDPFASRGPHNYVQLDDNSITRRP